MDLDGRGLGPWWPGSPSSHIDFSRVAALTHFRITSDLPTNREQQEFLLEGARP